MSSLGVMTGRSVLTLGFSRTRVVATRHIIREISSLIRALRTFWSHRLDSNLCNTSCLLIVLWLTSVVRLSPLCVAVRSLRNRRSISSIHRLLRLSLCLYLYFICLSWSIFTLDSLCLYTSVKSTLVFLAQ